MKRIICILLLICMLSGCAESGNSSNFQINTSEPSAAVTKTTSIEKKTEKSTEDNVKSTDITEFLSEKNVFSLYEISETKYLLTSFYDGKFLTEMVCLEGDGNISTFISDAPPVYEENGLWILHKTVFDPYDNDVNVNNSDKLICYDYNLNKTAEIDISGLDNVSACSVDFDNRHVYYTQDEIIDGCKSHYLKRMDFDGDTEILHEIKHDFNSGGSYILASISSRELFLEFEVFDILKFPVMKYNVLLIVNLLYVATLVILILIHEKVFCCKHFIMRKKSVLEERSFSFDNRI